MLLVELNLDSHVYANVNHQCMTVSVLLFYFLSISQQFFQNISPFYNTIRDLWTSLPFKKPPIEEGYNK